MRADRRREVLDVCLHSIGQSSPRLQELVELRDPRGAALVTALRADGFEHYGVSEQSVSMMAREACAETLRASGYDAASFDALIIVTESLWDRDAAAGARPSHLAVRDDLLRTLLVDLGLSPVQVHATWSAACGNLAPALTLAKSLLVAGAARRVLIVVTDRLAPGGSRALASGAGALSDIAAACVVERGRRGLSLDEILLQAESKMLAPGVLDNFILHARALKSGIAALDRRVADLTGLRLRDYDLIVTESFSEALIGYFCDEVEVERRKLAAPARGLYGHAFSADLLLSLRLLMSAGPDRPGSRGAAVSLSSWMLSATTFRLVGAAAGGETRATRTPERVA